MAQFPTQRLAGDNGNIGKGDTVNAMHYKTLTNRILLAQIPAQAALRAYILVNCGFMTGLKIMAFPNLRIHN